MSDDWTSGLDPEFVKAAAACARTNNGSEASTLSAYFRSRLRCVDRDAYKKLSKSLREQGSLSPRVAVVGDDVSLAPTPVHFVYMDVGCWAGDGGDNGWTRHREFGVVCGGLALLCAFEKGNLKGYRAALSPPKWKTFVGSPATTQIVDATVTKHPNWPRVQDFLKELAKDSDLGDLYLLGATMVASTLMPTPPGDDGNPIMVFIGDFHAPVATASSNAHIIENGQEMLRGRLKTLLAKPDRWAINVPGQIYDEAARLKREATDILAEMQWNAVTTRESVDNWLRIYHTGGPRAADIFQGAGADLRTFVDRLKVCHNSICPLYVVQLGDMFDLWLGFQRGFKKSIDDPTPDAGRFAQLWVKRTLFDADQGPHLEHFLTMSQTAGLNLRTGAALQTKFLYGNHDNYRKHPVGGTAEVSFNREHDELVSAVFGAPANLRLPGLWAEHGHQPDPSNHDEDPTRGYELTQAAYLKPGVRSLEGPATWASWKVNSGGIARVEGIKHAMRRCLLDHVDNASACRGIYVMGHTHEAMLKRVELMPWPPPKKASH